MVDSDEYLHKQGKHCGNESLGCNYGLYLWDVKSNYASANCDCKGCNPTGMCQHGFWWTEACPSCDRLSMGP